MLQMKTTSIRKRSQKIKNIESGKPIFTNASNEDDLKILKGEYLSNHWLDLTQDDLKILKVETNFNGT